MRKMRLSKFLLGHDILALQKRTYSREKYTRKCTASHISNHFFISYIDIEHNFWLTVKFEILGSLCALINLLFSSKACIQQL